MDNNIINISIDAMGGVNSPRAALEAISIACSEHSDLFFLIFGDSLIIPDLIKDYNIPESRYHFFPTEKIVTDEHTPVEALRNKGSSMHKAIEAVKEKVAHACVSCGNTGALLVMSKVVLGTLPGVKRPAIIGLFPTLSGRSVMLDMGANSECNEIFLFQFALMGSCFAKSVLKITDPKIGLLNIGVERFKGRELEHKAFNILNQSGLNFKGYIEGHDIIVGDVDVIVTDGFSGNIALKASEGTARICTELLRQACNNSIRSKIGAALLKPSLKSTFKRIDPNSNNGAMFIGIDGIVVKGHGNSETQGMLNAINVASDLAKSNINFKITEELHAFEEKGIGLNIVEKIKHTSAKIFGIAK